MDRVISKPGLASCVYRRNVSDQFLPALLCFFLMAQHPGTWQAQASDNLPVAFKWQRFERTFKSSVVYSNSLQDANLTVVFTSPLGETSRVYGFWDGGKTWRVRFAPDQPGRWSYTTSCSDTANKGLNDQSGKFTCTAANGPAVFGRHGPVKVARDHRHFEHADGTPFFWLADTVWTGGRVSTPKEWELYANVRVDQKFTVALWDVTQGEDSKQETAYTGFPDFIAINPEFFKRLEAKLETLTRVGLLNAIAPLMPDQSKDSRTELTDEQAALLVRYVAARWGADPVAWLFMVDEGTRAPKPERWKNIAKAAFGDGPHAPVILYAGDSKAIFDAFRQEKWVDAFGYDSLATTAEPAFKEPQAGSVAQEWKAEPSRPLVAFLPTENGVNAKAGKRFNAADIRRSAYWSLLTLPIGGVSYGGLGVRDWDSTTGPNGDKAQGALLPVWQRSLFMPGAKQMASLAKLSTSIEFWRLRPQSNIVATQPGNISPLRRIVAASTETKDLSVVYLPEERTLELMTDALPSAPAVSWFNPRAGESSPAVAVVGGAACQFPTPDPGDWLLIMKAGK